MNSSTLRRLAADHAMLHSELPPCYLFPPSSPDSSVDDLTQVTVLLNGPTGTPYAQGLWRLALKIPESYPKAPPKATFRTRMWHPNVDESTGSVCVDTLKKDWQPRLTLRDVLITIYCLLISPNPDSALNATAGHLLQDDYDSFARQARLMTSIHARIPFEYLDEVNAAKRRGETVGTAIREDAEQRPRSGIRSTNSLSSPIIRNLPERITSTQSATSNSYHTLEDLADEVESDMSESKENHPLPSPPAIPALSPRRSSSAKRPLSDLRIVESDYDVSVTMCLNPSEQNVVNKVNPSARSAASDSSRRGLQLAERSQGGNMTGRSVQEMGANGMGSIVSEERPTKRICSDSGKEDALDICEVRKLIEKPGPGIKSSRTSGVKGKIRVGLRRL